VSDISYVLISQNLKPPAHTSVFNAYSCEFYRPQLTTTSPAWLVSSTQTLRSFEPKNVIANDLHIWEALSPGFTSNMKIPCVDFTDLLDMATGVGQPDVRRALNH